jgi:hypothetical protein
MRHFRQLAKLLLAGAAVALSAFHPAAQARADVDVSVSIGQPGFYGRVNIGNDRPRLVYQEPVIIQQSPVALVQQPIYLRVPPAHYQRWGNYCGRYRACGQRVYFVQQPVVVHDRGYDRRDRWERRRDWHERRHDRHERWHHRHHDRHHGRHDHDRVHRH